MNIPADMPSADSENVYYSFHALKAKMMENAFSSVNIKILKEKLGDLRLPIFVFDIFENSCSLEVHPKYSEKFTLRLSVEGSIMADNEPTVSTVIDSPEDSILLDGALAINLDPVILKNPGFQMGSSTKKYPDDKSTEPALDLLISSQFWLENDYANTVLEHLARTKKIVAESIRALPDEELSHLQNLLAEINAEIDTLTEILGNIEQGQSISLQAVKYEDLIVNYYQTKDPQLGITLDNIKTADLDGLTGTKLQLVQSIVDLCATGRLSEPTAGSVRTGAPLNKVLATKTVGDTNISGSGTLQSVWHDTINKLKEDNLILENLLETNVKETINSSSGVSAVEIKYADLPNQIVSVILDFQYGGLVKDIFEGSWIDDWYYNNFARKILDQETDFAALNEFVKQLESLTETAKQIADTNVLGGSFLLTKQAIYKSLNKFCQNNVDVTEYAPMFASGDNEGRSIFDVMSRSPVLGPSGCHQYPSKYSLGDNEDGISDYIPNPFTKNGFLNYHAILYMIDTINLPYSYAPYVEPPPPSGDDIALLGQPIMTGNTWTMTNLLSADARSGDGGVLRGYIKQNIKKYDSDHDGAIKLWHKTNKASGSYRGKYSSRYTNPEDKDNGTTFKNLLHLYEINEPFNLPDDDDTAVETAKNEIYLIPGGDDELSSSERTFINFNQPFIRYQMEAVIRRWGPLREKEAYNRLSEKYPSYTTSTIIGSTTNRIYGGKLELTLKPPAHKKLGFSEDPDVDSKRTSRVHYGIFDADRWTGESGVNQKDVLEFYAQRNYNLPYYWAAFVSLCRGLTIEAYKFLFESISEITGTQISFTTEEIIDKFDTGLMFDAIIEQFSVLYAKNTAKFVGYGGPNGTLTYTGRDATRTSQINTIQFKNTNGPTTSPMLKSWINFTSMISENKIVQVVDNYLPSKYKYEKYVPPECLAIPTNQNFAKQHGGTDGYVSPDSFVTYADVLVYKRDELITGSDMKGWTVGPLSQNRNDLLEHERSWLSKSNTHWSHIFMHESFIGGLKEFETFVSSFEIPESFKAIFQEGHFEITDTIKSPGSLVRDIQGKREIYGPDDKYISKIYNGINFERLTYLEDKIAYMYVIGLKESAFDNNGFCVLQPQFAGMTGEYTLNTKDRIFSREKKKISDSDNFESEILSKEIKNYFHLVRGIRCDEPAFSNKTETVWSDIIRDSKSNIFPWSKDDFQGKKPKKSRELDTIFEISPLIFPRNYFYDVCLQEKYQKVVGVFITKSELKHLLELDSQTGKNYESVIGSIRWIVKNN